MRPGQALPWADRLAPVPPRLWLALGVVVAGGVLGYLAATINRRLLRRAGVTAAIEGTAFDRTAREFGSSTIDILAKLSGLFVFGIALVFAVTVADVRYLDLFWGAVVVFVPRLFVAALIIIVGVIVGDKVEVIVGERLRGVKLPEAGVLPTVANYSVVFVAALIALGQVGVATLALIVLLAAYAFGLILLTAVATKDLLAAGAAGVYLLLSQPYGIGDEVRVAGQHGIVQEIDLFVTHVETDDEEHILPNSAVFRDGIVRVRN